MEKDDLMQKPKCGTADNTREENRESQCEAGAIFCIPFPYFSCWKSVPPGLFFHSMLVDFAQYCSVLRKEME